MGRALREAGNPVCQRGYAGRLERALMRRAAQIATIALALIGLAALWACRDALIERLLPRVD